MFNFFFFHFSLSPGITAGFLLPLSEDIFYGNINSTIVSFKRQVKMTEAILPYPISKPLPGNPLVTMNGGEESYIPLNMVDSSLPPGAEDSSAGNPAADIQAENLVRRARVMVSLQDKASARAMNLVQMAETALKNGNPVSAHNFAQKVVQILGPGQPGSEPGKEIKLPEPKLPSPSRVKIPAEKKHTEHTYQDASNDPGVSFTYPGKLSGPQSFLAVRAHEYEHVRRSLRDAVLNGKRVMVLVSTRMRFDPATGEAYLAGGVTRTLRFPDIPAPETGKSVDTYA
jgi:hypothetical protein